MGRRTTREFLFPSLLLCLLFAQDTKGQSGPLRVCRSSSGGRVEPCADPPEPFDMVYPDYREASLEITSSGEIEFSLVINEEGMPQNIQLINSAGEVLDGPAAAALKKCKFKAGIDKGQAVAVELKMYLKYSCNVYSVLWPGRDAVTNYTVTQKTKGHMHLTQVMRECDREGPDLHKGVCAPRLLSRVTTYVDKDSELAKRRGTTALSVEIGKNGVVYDAVVIQSAGKDYDERAMAAVKQWRFQPALNKGQPIPVRATIEFPFWSCEPSMYWGYVY